MNRPHVILCVPLLLMPLAPAQEPFVVQVARQVLVRMAPNEVALNDRLLGAIAESAEAQQAVAKALGKRVTDPRLCTVHTGATTPQPAGVFQFTLAVTSTVTEALDRAAEDAAVQAAIDVLRQRLETLLVDGPRRELVARTSELEARLQRAEAQREQVSVRLLQLGQEDPSEMQKLVAELRRRRLDHELDLRTEEALQERLQKLIDQARRELADAGARVDAVVQESGLLGHTLAEQRKLLQVTSDNAAIQAMQKHLTDSETHLQALVRQRAMADGAVECATRRVQELASQATASTIALNRHASRLQVLQAALEQQQKSADLALAQAVDRARIEQQARRNDDAISVLRTRLLEVTQRLESLQSIRVELWR